MLKKIITGILVVFAVRASISIAGDRVEVTPAHERITIVVQEEQRLVTFAKEMRYGYYRAQRARVALRDSSPPVECIRYRFAVAIAREGANLHVTMSPPTPWVAVEFAPSLRSTGIATSLFDNASRTIDRLERVLAHARTQPSNMINRLGSELLQNQIAALKLVLTTDGQAHQSWQRFREKR